MPPVRRTEKQRIIMGMLIRAAQEGKFLGETELHRVMPYPVSYNALRVSIRFLEKGGMVKRERQGNRMLIVPTSEGFAWFSPR